MFHGKLSFRKYSALILFPLMLFSTSLVLAQGNTCTLGEVRTTSSRAFSLEIVISNTDTLAGFQIPFNFAYGNVGISCDSISFRGGACEGFGFQDIKIDNAHKLAYLSAIYDASVDDHNTPLAPGRHKVATAFFAVDRVDNSLQVAFEQSRIPDEYRDYSFLFWTPTAEEVPATFSLGNLKLR
jgi:hypothetical protein